MSEPYVPVECMRRFAEINDKLAHIPSMAEDVASMRIALMGNGSPEKGLLMRVLTLESSGNDLKRGWRGVIKWAISITTAVILLLVGMWIKGD